jgi:SAM-dependent methyltransferase
MGVFEHGRMEDPAYAYRVCLQHFQQLSRVNHPFTALELGPGDSLVSALVAHALGASETYLVDTGTFASSEPNVYTSMQDYLIGQGLPSPKIRRGAPLREVLSSCNAHYLADGIRSLRAVPNGSVDFVWSHAVLEHIHLDEFDPLLSALRRVLRSGGMSSHQIDLRDHLNMELNNLRFSRSIWESGLFLKSGFYTNRLRMSQLLQAFARAGFQYRIVHRTEWPATPIRRNHLHPEFSCFPDEELRISGFHVVCW